MKAPALSGDGWIGTDGVDLTLKDLRGRVVLLDFWTLCCVNCHHVLAELRPIEEKYRDCLTVIGVHSPKFEHEKSLRAVRSATDRHGINHPVLNDPAMSTWATFGIRAWPTLVLIDPLGDVVAEFSGEGHAHALDSIIGELVRHHEGKGSLLRGPGPYVPTAPPQTPYVQPAKIVDLGNGSIAISEMGAHRIAIAAIESPNDPLRLIGTGLRGRADGSANTATFNEPAGMARLPEEIAAHVGFDLVIADSANHVLRGVDSGSGHVCTIAGTGAQWMQGDSTSGGALATPLSTPWDVVWWHDRIYVAMAGDHRIWAFDPLRQSVAVVAGTSNEGLVDGSVSEAWFAQSSALAIVHDELWVLDAETSAVRRISSDRVDTLIGRGLFEFGHIDGLWTDALLQHPLGLAVTPDGRVIIADTYNGALRRIDPEAQRIDTIAVGLDEPNDVLVLSEHELLVLEGGSGRVERREMSSAAPVSRAPLTTRRPPLVIAPDHVSIEIHFTPPPGEKIDERFGPATQLVVEASPPELLASGAGRGVDLVRGVRIEGGIREGVLHVAARGASCESSENAVCHMHQQDWGIPVVVDPEGTRTVRLVLAGPVGP